MGLTVQTREKTGKSYIRQIRQQGLVPGIIMTKEGIKMVELREDQAYRFLLANQDKTVVFDLEFENTQEKKQVIVQDYQVAPYGRKLLHIDFREVTPDTKIKTSLAIIPSDNCPALKFGGIINIIRRQIPVEACVKDLPEALHIDAANLDFGAPIKVASITAPEGVRLLTKGENFTILTISGRSKGKGAAMEDDEAIEETEE